MKGNRRVNERCEHCREAYDAGFRRGLAEGMGTEAPTVEWGHPIYQQLAARRAIDAQAREIAQNVSEAPKCIHHVSLDSWCELCTPDLVVTPIDPRAS